MAIKKKVTYSVSYVAGTDTLTTKLNSLLQDIVTLILSQNTGLTVLDTITVGSERWTGAPLYDTYNSKLYSSDYNGRHYESDVIFIGTNEDNVCLSLGFFDGCLVAAMNMTPKVEAEYVADWTTVYGLNASTYLPFYATGKQSRWFKSSNSNAGRYCLPYRIVNNAIALSVIYWTGDYSRGYSFVNGAGESDGVDLVIFNTDEGSSQSGLGVAIWTWGRINNSGGTYYNSLRRVQVTAFSFSENLSSNKPAALPTGNSNIDPGETQQQLINSRYDIRIWGAVNNSAAAGSSYFANFQSWHALCGTDGNVQNYAYQPNSPDLWYSINNVSNGNDPSNALAPSGNRGFSPLAMGYNLPHLQPGQAYIRKMRVPGWNPECKGEVYLLWSPVLTAYQSGDIVEVGSKSYAIITEGAVAWAARVS
jgi:hypothetical protein